MKNVTLNIFFILFSILLTVGALEVGAIALYEPRLDPICEECYAQEVVPDIGYWNKKSFSHTARKFCAGGELCYERDYSYDRYGRRTVPNQRESDKHLIIFGGSFVIGEGLDAGDSLPSQLQSLTSSKVYNYGLSGGGANTALALLQSGKVLNEVPERNGTAIYVSSDFHIYRTLMTSSRMWSRGAPYFDYDGSNKLKYIGVMEDVFPGTVAIYEAYNSLKSNSRFLTALDLSFPPLDKNELISLYVDIVRVAKDKYVEQFGGRFVVAFHPSSSDKGLTHHLHQKLLKNGIESFLIPRSVLDKRNLYLCSCDFHPSASVNKTFAKELSRILSQE